MSSISMQKQTIELMSEKIYNLYEKVKWLTRERDEARSEVARLRAERDTFLLDARNATPAETLEQRIMDPCIPKSEAEWWAPREIERQRAEIERLRADLALERSRIVFQRGEIEKQRAEIERLRAQIGRLRSKIKWLIEDDERLHYVLYRIANPPPFADCPVEMAQNATRGEHLRREAFDGIRRELEDKP